MTPRFVGRFGLADGVTIANAALGLFAVIAAPAAPGLAARLILLAAIADGLDGVLARAYGHTPVGDVLDSLADVVSFGVAPALLVFHLIRPGGWELSPGLVLAASVSVTFLVMAVIRLGLYTTDDLDHPHTDGVQTTLAATLLATAVLVGVSDPLVLLVGTAILASLMVTGVTYPDLRARDAMVMGIVQLLAVAVPYSFGRVFPWGLFVAACCYLMFGPRFYRRGSNDGSAAGSEGTTHNPLSSESR